MIRKKCWLVPRWRESAHSALVAEVWIRLLGLLEMDNYTARKNVNTFPVGREDDLFFKGPLKKMNFSIFFILFYSEELKGKISQAPYVLLGTRYLK